MSSQESPRYADYHRTVVGFHGTRRLTALQIVSGESGFKPSKNAYDWLGHGVYFWEYAPQQAWDWARQRYKDESDDEIAVLGSMIRLGNCFDLLDPGNLDVLEEHHAQLKQDAEDVGQPLKQNARNKKYLDCAVFNTTYLSIENQGEAVDTAQAVFVPSAPKDRLWNSSGLFRGAHIQLCVRNLECILGVWLVQPEG